MNASHYRISIVSAVLIGLAIVPPPLATGSYGSAHAEVSRAETDEVIAAVDFIVKYNFPFARMQADENGNLDEARAALESFRSEAEAKLTPTIIANANDSSERRLVSLKARANRFAETYDRSLADADLDSVKQYGSSRPIFIKYMSFVVAREKLALLRKIYGDTPEIAAATATSNRAFAVLGDFASVEGQAADVRAAYLAETRLPAATRVDAVLGRQFASAFESSVYNTGNGGGAKVTRVNLTSSGWSVERNEITGVILLRYQYAALALKDPDGRCYVDIARFEQKHQSGGSYGGTYYRSGSRREGLCENL